jgi:hypothetical protein
VDITANIELDKTVAKVSGWIGINDSIVHKPCLHSDLSTGYEMMQV